MQERIIDISPTLSETTAVWPGDKNLARQVQAQISPHSPIYLSSLMTTVHIGAHADAPSHYTAGASDIDAVDLGAYIGPCHVVTVDVQDIVRPADIAAALQLRPQRLLLRTKSFPNPEHFSTDFVAIAAETIHALAAHGCVLIGIDTPSVDPFSSKDLPAHHALAATGMRNLEGLVLSHVSDGPYELIALPLKLKGFDASPVRAILRCI